jgi:hypothetical protein
VRRFIYIKKPPEVDKDHPAIELLKLRALKLLVKLMSMQIDGGCNHNKQETFKTVK